MPTGSLRVYDEDRVRVLVIDRPAVRNALDPETLDALSAAMESRETGAIVLTGAGKDCFTSGVDLRSVRTTGAALGAAVRRFQAVMRSPERLPVVAAVRGLAVGGGFEITMMCDLVVAAEDGRFGLPEVNHGLVPGGGGTLLPARVPLAVALEIGLLGELFGAERARELGLVNRVVPTDAVVAEAVALAAKLAAKPPATLARIRQLMTITAQEGAAASESAAREFGTSQRLRAEAADGIARFLGPPTKSDPTDRSNSNE
jgi:enoyl-CoA hydratase